MRMPVESNRKKIKRTTKQKMDGLCWRGSPTSRCYRVWKNNRKRKRNDTERHCCRQTTADDPNGCNNGWNQLDDEYPTWPCRSFSCFRPTHLCYLARGRAQHKSGPVGEMFPLERSGVGRLGALQLEINDTVRSYMTLHRQDLCHNCCYKIHERMNCLVFGSIVYSAVVNYPDHLCISLWVFSVVWLSIMWNHCVRIRK